ncbi:MAG: C-GCAxxG-C-C family protein [Candidatus Merdivicinus sp.]|jgi:C_GCAxxG_C_C family probable redox protein
MKNRAQEAEAAFREGYNCSQAVAVAFADRIGLEKDFAARLVSGFGGGFGRLREVCGAVSGMVFVANALSGYQDPKAAAEKAVHYAQIQKLAEAFRAETGSIVCRELLGLPTGKEPPVPEARTDAYYKKRPCPELVRLAAEILCREYPEME